MKLKLKLKQISWVVISCLASSSLVAEQQGTVGNLELWPAKVHQIVSNEEARIDTLLDQLSIKDKVAQLIMPEIRYVTPADFKRLRLGSVLNGGGAFPNNNKQASLEDWVKLAQAYHDASIANSKLEQPIPVIWGTDAVHGHNNVYRATIFPHNIGLGATRNPELLEQIGKVTAAEVAATGIFWTFAPTITVPQNARWGRTYEGYSEDADLVSSLGVAMVKGLQGGFPDNRLAADKVLSTAKHFIGDGGTYQGIDQGNARVSEAELKNVHGTSYVQALEAGVQSVMASFNSWNGEKLHGQHYLLTQVLKDRMGFDGLVVGDWNGHGQLPGCTNGDCAAAINAGVDIIMVPENWAELYTNTLKQAKNGTISEARLDDAVRRILRFKLRAGLFDGATPQNRARSGDSTILSNPQHRLVARQAVKESLVLLKNNNQTLPLDASKTTLVVGIDAQKVEKQLGGWSLSWQGTGNTNKDFPEAQSIFTGIDELIKSQGGITKFSKFKDLDSTAMDSVDAAIVVFGEPPYAEGQGDRENLAFKTGNKHLQVMRQLKAQGIPVVAIFLTGRPLWVNPELNAADAFVAAWLPGSEAGAMSEILFCDSKAKVDCDFKGKLPFSWPSTLTNSSRQGSKALFTLGYGLSYADTQQLPEFEESLSAKSTEYKTLLKGWAQSPYSVSLQSGKQLTKVDKPKVAVNDKALTTAIIDNKIQEDAQRIAFAGRETSAWMLTHDEQVDWSETAKTTSLNVEVKMLKADKKQPIYWSVLCGKGCSGTIDVSDSFRQSAKKQWTDFSIELSCLEKLGLNLEKVTAPAILSTAGKWKFEMAAITLTKKPTGKKISCPV